MSIVRVGLAETKNFSEGYDLIFGKKEDKKDQTQKDEKTAQQGEAQDPNIRMRASSDDLVAMVNGELGLMKSYLSGRVRIEASLSDLLALRKLA